MTCLTGIKEPYCEAKNTSPITNELLTFVSGKREPYNLFVTVI